MARWIPTQVLEGRRWQLDLMREGFRDGDTFLPETLCTFKPGAERRRLVCGQEVTTAQLLEVIEFDEASYAGDAKNNNQPDMTREVLKALTDDEAKVGQPGHFQPLRPNAAYLLGHPSYDIHQSCLSILLVLCSSSSSPWPRPSKPSPGTAR